MASKGEEEGCVDSRNEIGSRVSFQRLNVSDRRLQRREKGVEASRRGVCDDSSHNARVLIASLDTRPILVSMGPRVLIAYSITWTFTG